MSQVTLAGEENDSSVGLKQELGHVSVLLAELNDVATEFSAAITRLNGAHKAVASGLKVDVNGAAGVSHVENQAETGVAHKAARADRSKVSGSFAAESTTRSTERSKVSASFAAESTIQTEFSYPGSVHDAPALQDEDQIHLAHRGSSDSLHSIQEVMTDTKRAVVSFPSKSAEWNSGETTELFDSQNSKATQGFQSRASRTSHIGGQVRLRALWCETDAELMTCVESTSNFEIFRIKHEPGRQFSKSFLSKTQVELVSPHFGYGLCLVAHPGGPSRLAWNGLCLALITWDILIIPMQAFSTFESIVLTALEWLSTIAWTFDLFINFRTGYFVGTKLETRPEVIAWHYITTWFAVDLFLVSMEWIGRFTAVVAPASLVRTSRIFRTLRFIKLLRLVKMQNLWVHVKEQINSNAFHLVFNMTLMTFALMLAVHIIACAWYALGVSELDGWTSYDSYEGKKGIVFWYLASSRWVIAQVNGRTDMNDRRNMLERGFTCVVGVTLAVIAKAIFTSVMTKTMLELSQLTSEKTRRRRLVNEYLETHQLSSALTTSVKRFLQEYRDPDSEQNRENQVLAILPRHVRGDLLLQVRAPRLTNHPLFMNMNVGKTRSVRYICQHVVVLVSPASYEVVFDKDDPCSRMLFVEKGILTYGTPLEYDDDEMESQATLSPGNWISEPALWIEWINCGRLLSDDNACLYAIPAKELAASLKEDINEYTRTVMYAKCFTQELASQIAWSDIVSFQVRIRSRTPTHLDIQVIVSSANGLLEADSKFFMSRSKADAYCICRVSGTEKSIQTCFKTKVIDNCMEPAWNHTGYLSYSTVDMPLIFEVWDKDTFSQDDFLGKATLEASQFMESGFNGSIPLVGPKADGNLKVKIDVLAARGTVPIVPAESAD